MNPEEKFDLSFRVGLEEVLAWFVGRKSELLLVNLGFFMCDIYWSIIDLSDL